MSKQSFVQVSKDSGSSTLSSRERSRMADLIAWKTGQSKWAWRRHQREMLAKTAPRKPKKPCSVQEALEAIKGL
jgi:hypothetical protein